MTKELGKNLLKKSLLLISIIVLIGCNLAARSTEKTNTIRDVKREPTPTRASTPMEVKLYNVNLINNGGGEGENTSPWTNPDNNLKTFRYDGGWGDDWKVTPPNRGDSYFYAKVFSDKPVADFMQKADISKIAEDVDAGKVAYNMGAWFGIRGGSAVRLKATFFDANSAEIKSEADAATEKMDDSNKPDDVTMVQKTNAGTVPAGTRSIKTTLEFYLFRNIAENDGEVAMADSLSFVLIKKEAK